MFEDLVETYWYGRLKEREDDNIKGTRGVVYFCEEFRRENIEVL